MTSAGGEASRADRTNAARPPADPDAIAATRPGAPSRAEVGTLIRAIGSDPATGDLVDWAWAARLQLDWKVDLRRVDHLATDPGFTQRLDQTARQP